MPDRLPPPPFWRTRYFAEKVINKPGRQIDPAEILATLAAPDRRAGAAGRPGATLALGCLAGPRLRVVTLADGVTVHNAFWDRSFRP